MGNIYVTDWQGSFARAKVGFSLFKFAEKLTFQRLKDAPKLKRGDSVLDLSRPFAASFTIYGNAIGTRTAFPTFVQNNQDIMIQSVRYSRSQTIDAAREVLGTQETRIMIANPNYHIVFPKDYNLT